MEKYKKILSFLPFILSICISIYLTYLVDFVTLNTFFERAFVFAFFILSTSILFYLFKRYVGLNFSLKLIASALLLSLSVIILFKDSFFSEKTKNAITFEAMIEDNANHAQEVWLAEIEIDGKSVSLSELNVLYNNGWHYMSDLDDYVYYPISSNNAENNNELTIEVLCKNIKIVFACNSWSGKVSYALNSSNEFNTLELYSADNSVQSEQLSLDFSLMKSPWTVFFQLLGATITVFFFVYQLLVIINQRCLKRKKQTAISQNFIENSFVFSIYFLLINIFLRMLETQYTYIPENITLNVGFFVLLLIFPYSSRVFPMFKKLKIAEIILLFVVVFIVTFQTTAEIIFMELDKTTISFIDISTFIIAMAIVAVPILEITLFIDKRTQNRFGGGEKIEK